MNKIKRFIAFIVCSIMIVSIVGCGKKGETIEQSVTNAINALKTQNGEQITKYFNQIEDLDLNESEDDDLIPVFKKLACKVLSSSENGDTGTAQVEITNIDMGAIMGEYFSKGMSEALSNALAAEEDKISDEDMAESMEALLLEMIDSSEATKTFTVDISLNKKEDYWQVVIDNNDDLLNALTGGLLNIGKNLEQNLNTAE